MLLPHLGRPVVSVGKQPAGNDFMSQNSFTLLLTISVFHELLEARFDAGDGVAPYSTHNNAAKIARRLQVEVFGFATLVASH